MTDGYPTSADSMKNILASRLIVPILAKIFTVIVIVLGLARLLSLNNDTTNEPILCINAQKIEDCECKDVNIDTNGTNRCYNLDLCPNVDIECPPNEYKIALENEDCPICMPNPCSHLQTVVGCSCSSNEIIEISQDLSFCNKEENPCPKISLSDCDSDHRLHFQYELNGNVLSDCPKCVQNICTELSRVDDCVCELKSLQIDGTNYCISVDECGLNLNPDNSCSNGGELQFLNGPNRCPKCVQDKCPELSEVDDCVCELKSLQIDGTSYCISVDKCGLNLNPNNSCSNGGELQFLNGPNRCPKCVQDKCPELSEVDDCVCELKILQIDSTSYCISVDKCGLNLNPDNSCSNGGKLRFLNGNDKCPECNNNLEENNPNKNNNIYIIIGVILSISILVILGIVGYFYFKNQYNPNQVGQNVTEAEGLQTNQVFEAINEKDSIKNNKQDFIEEYFSSINE